jgi:glycosyltransferase involved in cell wall biosynthesis
MDNLKNIKISIIVPVFNVEEYIEKCLETLINQTLKEIEIILIDDKSTDNSVKICRRYAKKDNRLVIISNEKQIKQGLSRNKGISIAKGEFVGFIDPDDWIDLNFFEKLYKAATSSNSDIAKGEVVFSSKKGEIKLSSNLNEQIKKGLKKGIHLSLLFSYEHCAAIYKRKLLLLNNIQYAALSNAEDAFFLLQVSFFSKKIILVKHIKYYYRQHVNSTESLRDKNYYNNILEYFRLHIEFINELDIQKNLYDQLFLNGYKFVKNRYYEIKTTPNLKNYENEYIENLFIISARYKYGIEKLLSSYYNGYNIRNTQKLILNSKLYKLSKAIMWLPVKILVLFNKIGKLAGNIIVKK